jgi:hypothetical protein
MRCSFASIAIAILTITSALLVATTSTAEPAQAPETQSSGVLLQDWGKTLVIRSREQRDVMMCLWFYEWHMFDAVVPGQHTLNSTVFPWDVHRDANEAVLKAPGMSLIVKSVADGAELTLEVTNQTDHDWPELASIVPCFTPGSIRGPNTNTRFIDDQHMWTHYLGPVGLAPLKSRDLHCCENKRRSFISETGDGDFAWSSKWALSRANAAGGLMVREGKDGQWVAGIAWDHFLSCQGHNPWKCMHLSVNVGPLRRGESKTLRGRVFLFRGTKDDCLEKYRDDFG